MTPASPETPPAARMVDIRAALDAALMQLRAIEQETIPAVQVERSLGRALEHVYAALADNDQHAAFRERSGLALEEARAALAHLMTVPSEDPAADQTMRAIAKCIGDLQQVGWSLLEGWNLPREDTTRPYLRASTGLPRLLELQRDVLRPAVPLDEPIAMAVVLEKPEVLPAPPRTLAEVTAMADAHWARVMAEAEAAKEASQTEAEPEPEPEPKPPPSVLGEDEALRVRFGVRVSDDELLAERTRDCLDDLSMLGRMRRCTDPEPWASGDETEARMLLKVDAIAACGVKAFPELVRALDDRPLPDPELTFGNLYFFLSIDGDDAFQQAARLLELADLDSPGMLEMCIDAFVLAPHPRISAAVSAWLAHPSPTRRLHAVEVLRRRRVFTQSQLDSMGNDPDPRVIAALARALATLPTIPSPGALSWFLNRDQEPIERAALESAMLLRREVGYARAVELTRKGDGAWADAAMFVAIAGGHEARAVLEDDIASAGSPTSLRAIGWYGDTRFVPFLLGRLRHGGEASAFAALAALERITGASILDASMVPTYEHDDEPFTRTRREYEPVGLLDGDPDAWERWWETWKTNATPDLRYRWGRPYQISDTLMELRGEEFLQRDRPWAVMELTVRGRSATWPDWNDLVLRQHAVLDGVRASCPEAERWGGGLSA
ncbi:MAG: hypothetical protein AB8I08_27535 [Sandaracinaceae bacterium]